MIIALVPALINAIKAIEDAVPGSGLGQQKLEALRQILVAADEKINDLWPKLQGIIGILVTLFNGTIWKKG
jgi:hypothetical protein